MIALPTPRFLASVRDAGEARLAAGLGAEIIDLKEPDQGALGAVARDEQTRILAALGDDRPTVSATVGDLPFDPAPLAAAIRATAAVGVDIVKFGVFAAGEDQAAGFAALDACLRADPPHAALVVLLLADRLRDIDQAIALAAQALRVHGVAGVMLDTAGKGAHARSLPQVFGSADLTRFVAAVHDAGGFAGLAGSLRIEHIAALAATGADLLGFRGALCVHGRNAALDAGAFVRVRDQVSAARAARKAAAAAPNTNPVATAGRAAATSG